MAQRRFRTEPAVRKLERSSTAGSISSMMGWWSEGQPEESVCLVRCSADQVPGLDFGA